MPATHDIMVYFDTNLTVSPHDTNCIAHAKADSSHFYLADQRYYCIVSIDECSGCKLEPHTLIKVSTILNWYVIASLLGPSERAHWQTLDLHCRYDYLHCVYHHLWYLH